MSFLVSFAKQPEKSKNGRAAERLPPPVQRRARHFSRFLTRKLFTRIIRILKSEKQTSRTQTSYSKYSLNGKSIWLQFLASIHVEGDCERNLNDDFLMIKQSRAQKIRNCCLGAETLTQ